MSEDIALSDANIREIQRLRGLLAASAERERIVVEDKERAWTDAAALRGLITSYQNARYQLENHLNELSDDEVLMRIREKKAAEDGLKRALYVDYPGASIYTDLADLRAALTTAQQELDVSQPIVIAAARLDASIRGDGNGRCWCGAREADQLRSALEQAGRDVAPQK